MVIAGGHGKIALQLSRLLAQRGDTVIGLIRNPDHADDDHADDVAATGAEAAVFDLESAAAEVDLRAPGTGLDGAEDPGL